MGNYEKLKETFSEIVSFFPLNTARTFMPGFSQRVFLSSLLVLQERVATLSDVWTTAWIRGLDVDADASGDVFSVMKSP